MRNKQQKNFPIPIGSCFNSAVSIVKKLRHRGFESYFAGGCVRDILLKKSFKDIDIATEAKPEDVCALFKNTKQIGAHFGVVLLRFEKNSFEIATFRKDSHYEDGRRPKQVYFTNAEEDAKRRDFTINGVFYEPLEEKFLDFVGGCQDIKKKLICTIGKAEDRFSEDYLRILRALRFATTLDFKICPHTWQAIKKLALKINLISKERSRDELVKIIMHKNRLHGIKLLIKSGVMRELVPEVLAMDKCQQPEQFHPEGDVLEHTLLMIKKLPDKAPLDLILSVIFHDIGKPPTQKFDKKAQRFRFNNHEHVGSRMCKKIMQRLKFANQITEKVFQAVDKHMVFKDVQKMRQAKLRRFMSRENFSNELKLHKLDCISSHKNLDNYNFLLKKLKEFDNELLVPPPLLSGLDLIQLGLKPGPQFGLILKKIQDKQLNKKLTSKKEAINFIKKDLL